MKKEIIFAGFGGQGVLLAGKIICNGAMHEGNYVTYLPAYGPEMRGGTANCSVVISDVQIASPILGDIDILLAMNQPSYDKFVKRVRADGVIVYNKSLVNQVDENDTRNVAVDFTNLAGELGNVRVCSMIALGSLVAKTKVISMEQLMIEMKKLAAKKPELVTLNEKAINLGASLI